MSDSYLEIELDQQPIELCKLLKIANLVAGGGEAKVVISEGYVFVNGEVEYQKRKKVYHNDVVEFNGEIIQVIVNEDLAKQPINTNSAIKEKLPTTISNNTDSMASNSLVNNTKIAAPTNNGATTKNKRKPISF